MAQLHPIANAKVGKTELTVLRTRGAYITAVCRLYLIFGFSHALLRFNRASIAARVLLKCIICARGELNFDLEFVIIDIVLTRLRGLADVLFTTNADLTSQPGLLVTLADQFCDANMLYYTCIGSKRETGTELAAELCFAITAFYIAATIRVTLYKVIVCIIPLSLDTASKFLHCSLVDTNATAETRITNRFTRESTIKWVEMANQDCMVSECLKFWQCCDKTKTIRRPR